MNFKYLLLFMFVCYESVTSGPVLREVGSWMEELEPEEKIREKRKIDLLQHLENGGVGVKKSMAANEEDAGDGARAESLLTPDVPAEANVGTTSGEEEGKRSKKQTPDSVCIKVGNGKTACGRVVSARGPITKMLMRNDPALYLDGQGSEQKVKMDRYPSMQSRTFDSLLPLSSLASGVTYAVPTATYAAEAAPALPALGHSVSTIAAPAVHVAPLTPLASFAHLEPLSLNLLPHPIPIPSMHAMLTHHPLMNVQRLELPKLPEVIYTPTEVKQPAYEVKPIVTARPVSTPYVYPSRYGVVNSGYDGPMICHPYDEKLSQQVIQIRPEVHVVESAHKVINSSAEEFKSQTGDGSEADEKGVHEHLRKVNDIMEEMNQLNKAAQRIVDQQERLAEMQQRHLWKSEEKLPYSPYNALRMYMVPPTYSKANAIAYPTSMDDMEFFLNLLRTGKRIGALSETLQPAFNSAIDATRLVLGADQQGQQADGSQSGKGSKKNSANGQTTDVKADKN